MLLVYPGLNYIQLIYTVDSEGRSHARLFRLAGLGSISRTKDRYREAGLQQIKKGSHMPFVFFPFLWIISFGNDPYGTHHVSASGRTHPGDSWLWCLASLNSKLNDVPLCKCKIIAGEKDLFCLVDGQIRVQRLGSPLSLGHRRHECIKISIESSEHIKASLKDVSSPNSHGNMFI